MTRESTAQYLYERNLTATAMTEGLHLDELLGWDDLTDEHAPTRRVWLNIADTVQQMADATITWTEHAVPDIDLAPHATPTALPDLIELIKRDLVKAKRLPRGVDASVVRAFVDRSLDRITLYRNGKSPRLEDD